MRTGVAFPPLAATLFAVSRLAPRMLPVFGARRLMIAGMFPVIAGMAWLWRVVPGTGYWDGVFGPMLLFGVGMGIVFVPLTAASLAGVRPEDSGAASGMVNVMQQVGGSLGLPVLVAVFGTVYEGSVAHHAAGLSALAVRQHALIHGMPSAYGLAAIFDVVTLFLIVALLRAPARRPADAAGVAAEPGLREAGSAAL